VVGAVRSATRGTMIPDPDPDPETDPETGAP
jgi:hypothetical protein